MKPFEPLTVEAQATAYASKLTNSLAAKKRQLNRDFEESPEVRNLQKLISTVRDKVDPAQDRVANAADREFGATTWRANKKLLTLVGARMAAVAEPFLTRIEKLEKQLADFRSEITAQEKADQAEHDKLMKSCALHLPKIPKPYDNRSSSRI